MFTVTQRLLLTQPVSLPPVASATLPTPFTPNAHQPNQPGGCGEGAFSSPYAKARESQTAPAGPVVPALPCPCGGTGLGLGSGPQLPALQPVTCGEGAIVRPKEELRNVLFICVCDQVAPPCVLVYGLVFICIFFTL